jgi:hypothetical protein
MHSVHEKENRVIRRASPVLHHRFTSEDTQYLAAIDMNCVESGKMRPRKSGEVSSTSARRSADHSSMLHLRSIYGGRPQKLSGTLSSSKREDDIDVDLPESAKPQGQPADRGTVAELIRRFRLAPPAPREQRHAVNYWWRECSDSKTSDTSADFQPSQIEAKLSRRRASSAQSSHREVPSASASFPKRPLSANSVANAGSNNCAQPSRNSPKTAYEYDAEIDQRLKGAEHLLSNWKLKKKGHDSSSMINHDAKRQISATVSILKRKLVPLTCEAYAITSNLQSAGMGFQLLLNPATLA